MVWHRGSDVRVAGLDAVSVGRIDSRVCSNAWAAGVSVLGGYGGDNGGSGAGGVAVPHLQCAADACGGVEVTELVQWHESSLKFMTHVLGPRCMSDSKGMWARHMCVQVLTQRDFQYLQLFA